MQHELEIKLMNALEAESRQSQRRLSEACDVSLGTIHYCLNALIEKGFVKAQNFRNAENKLAYAYILTPSGINHKRKITIAFLKRKKQEFDTLKREIALIEDRLRQKERQ
jgi:EPS-associated MarR family transcriptional regulator